MLKKNVLGGDFRIGAVDWLRFLALVEICGFHTNLGRIPLIAGLGLPLLLVITNLFNYTIVEHRTVSSFMRGKFRRLLLPWLFWCAIFAAITIAYSVFKGVSFGERFSPRILLAGTYAHLWFVPFAIFAGFAVSVLNRFSRAWPAWPLIGGMLAAGFGLLYLFDSLGGRLRSIDLLVEQWAFAMPSVFIGLALGRALLVKDLQARNAVLAVIVIVGAALWLLLLGNEDMRACRRYAASVALCALALGLNVRQDRVIAFLAPLTLGIYLAHPLIIEFMWATRLSKTSSLEWTAIAIPLSILLVWAMRRSPMRRFV